MVDRDAIRTKLEAHLAENSHLQKKLEAHLRNEDREVPNDWQERGTFLNNDEVMEKLDDKALAKISLIQAALKRLDTDDFGICGNCGDDIAAGRLDIIPWAPLCTTCAAAASE